jgi:hypothetical protein
VTQLYVVASAESSSFTAECDYLAHRFGNAADHPDRQRRYGTDMTDAEWAVVRAALPVPAWMDGRGGRPEGYCHRQMVDQCREVKRSAAMSRVGEVRKGPLLSRGSTKIFLRKQRLSGPLCHGRNR